MRLLTEKEVEAVAGGNFMFGVFGIGSAYGFGKMMGQSINDYNLRASDMSLGEAIYLTFDSN